MHEVPVVLLIALTNTLADILMKQFGHANGHKMGSEQNGELVAPNLSHYELISGALLELVFNVTFHFSEVTICYPHYNITEQKYVKLCSPTLYYHPVRVMFIHVAIQIK